MIFTIPSYRIVGGKFSYGYRSSQSPYQFSETSEPIIDPITSSITVDTELGTITINELGSTTSWSNYSNLSSSDGIMFQPNTAFLGGVIAPYATISGFNNIFYGDYLPNGEYTGNAGTYTTYGVGAFPVTLGPSKLCSPIYGLLDGKYIYGVIYSEKQDFSTVEGFAYIYISDNKIISRIFEKINAVEIIPSSVTHLKLTPTLQYVEKDETIQFTLEATYDDGSSEDVTSKASWGLGRDTIEEPVSELYGFTITSEGLLTAVDPTVSSIIVSGKFGGLGLYTTVYVSGYPGVYFPGGTTGIGGGSTGGGGSFGKNEVSDVIDVPSGSVAGDASSTGMYTRYLANSSYLDTFGKWLWTTDFGLHVARTVISLIYGNPADSVISLMSYPFDIKTLSGVTSREQNLVWGNFDSGLSFKALTSNSATIDWGTITLEEYWGNFLDYEPHTKIEMYLPWGTGFVSIDPGQCLPGTLQVITNIDLAKGSCIHNVIGNNGCVIGTYSGQCSQQIPILSNDYASKIAGVVVGATALAVAGTAGGGAISAGNKAAIDYGSTHSMPFGDAVGMSRYHSEIESAMASAEAPYQATQRAAGKLAAASSLASLRRSGIIARNGSFTDGSAALGVQYPYIVLSRPTQSVPEEYGHHYGYPSNVYVKLVNIRGYTEVGEIHLDGISATESEIAELDSILKGGVIF